MNDLKVGITQYVSHRKRFRAYWKSSDFQVNEIGMDGKVVHLTDQTVSEEFNKTTEKLVSIEQQLSVLTAEQWKSIEDMINSEEPAIVQINVIEKTKEERKEIAKIISVKYKGLHCKTSNNILNVSINLNGEQGCVSTRDPPAESLFTQFVLYKENLSTTEAIAKLVTRKQSTATFCAASHQIIRAKTSQLVTAWNWNPKNILGHLKSQQHVLIGNFTFTQKPLQPGQFMGNHYTIALSQVTGDKIHIKSSVESLVANGFINYFETDCFEINNRTSMHSIGKNVLMEQWLEVVNLILEPQFYCPEKLSGKEYVALVNATSNNAFESAKLLKKQSMESQLIFCLYKFGSKYIHRLADLIPRATRLNYIRSYQQFIWNIVASKRIDKFGLKPIIGDLVYCPVSDGCEAANDANGTVVFVTEENIDNYTINDVLLPLPGSDTTFPSNEVADWYTDLLLVDGVSDFKQRIRNWNISKEYRLLIRKPRDLTWKFVHYDDASMDLISSDLDLLLERRKPYIVESGAYLGLVLEFKLPPSTYASMALREIIHLETTAELYSPDPETQPSTSIICESSEEPEVKRIKLDKT